MSTILDWDLWRPSFAIITLGATAVFLAVLLVQRWVRSMTWRRTIWQIAFLSVGLLTLAELSGTGRLASNWARTPLSVPEQTTTLIEAKVFDEPDPELLAAARTQSGAQVINEPVNAVVKPTVLQWPTALWLGGIGVVLAWMIVLRLCFWLLVRRRPVRDEALLARVDAIARRLGLSQQVHVTEVRQLTGPIAHGILRPGISLPEGFADRFPTAQQDVMLAHELAHLAARDPLWHTLTDVVMSLVWWHPLAWLARHKLHAVTEAAADEASLIVENGPTALAECLVDLGNRLSHRRALGWLGMAGGGFRSGLAKRVSRLLTTESQTWNPPAPYRVSLTRAMSSLAIAAVILVSAAWAQPTAAGPTTLRDAFQRSVLGIMLTTALPTPQQATEVTNRTDEVLPPPAPPKSTNEYVIRAGDTLSRIVSTFREQGSSITQQALREANPDVHWNRLRIGQRIVIPYATTLSTIDRRELLNAKLDSIVLDEIEFDGATLGQAIEKLGKIVKERDPDGKGLNFISNGRPPPEIDPATGLAIERSAAPQTATLRLKATLRNITLRQTLDAIVASASIPIRYSVEDYAVIFTSNPPAPAVHTRFFKIDLETFEQALLAAAKTDLSQAISNAVKVSRTIDIPSRQNLPSPNQYVSPGPTRYEMLLVDTKRYFAQLGVDFSAPGRELVYSERRGQLMTRATLEELDIVEQAIGDLTTPPPQVTIEAQVYEISDEDYHKSGFKWFLESVGDSQNKNTKREPDQTFAWMTNGGFPIKSIDGRTHSGTPTNFSAILTEPQRRVVYRAMEQRGLTNLLKAPKMTMLSGRQGQFKRVAVRYIVTDLDWSSTITSLTNPPTAQPIAEPFELGPVLDVVPHVQADGKTIELTTIPTITEFEGYDLENPNRREIVTMPDGRKEIVVVPNQPQPIFRKRQIVSSATVKDGHTLVLAGGSSHFYANPIRNQALQPGAKIPTNAAPTHLLIFITPTLVDPAGNRINPPE
jgi:beta-lactamase regulating signal transducer with metallopeptidase domain